MIAYHAPHVAPSVAKEHPLFARLLYAGPWRFLDADGGGTIAVWGDYPEPGQAQPHALALFGKPVACEPGLFYLPPKQPLTPAAIYGLVKEGTGTSGIDVTLACGVTITIPPALISHRRRPLSARGRAAEMWVTEYGQLAHELLLEAREKGEDGKPKGVEPGPRLDRLLALAIGQRYRTTPELLDDLALLADEDVDPILGAAWGVAPKAERRAGETDAPSPSDSSASTTPS